MRTSIQPSSQGSTKGSRRRRVVVMAGAAIAVLWPATGSAPSVGATAAHSHIDCSKGNIVCSEVSDSEAVFGEGTYIGHDEIGRASCRERV